MRGGTLRYVPAPVPVYAKPDFDLSAILWFIDAMLPQKEDVQRLKGNFAGPLSKQQLLTFITHRDLLLSNQNDVNDVLSILDKCIVVNRRPDDEIPPIDTLPTGIYVSRYSISFGETPGTSIITVYDGENQPWPDVVAKGGFEDRVKDNTTDAEHHQQESNNEGNTDKSGVARVPQSSLRESFFGEADTDGSFEESGSESSETPLSEGANTKGRIQVGPDHQANLEKLEGKPVVSRNPNLVWIKEAGSAVEMDMFLEESSKILYDHLLLKGLLTQEQFFPFPAEQMQIFLTKQQLSSMTLSNLSTGSSMTKSSNRLTRECKLDNLIELLHLKQYNIAEALKMVQAVPQDFVTSWTKIERDLFEAGFRRYSGSLRMIAVNSLHSKNFKDIVDFHYRFMIPGQFRRYQDKKRENAVRMMEIIENRRAEGTAGALRDDQRRRSPSDLLNGKTDWSKTPVTDVLGVVDERRSSAKDLLIDIQNALGSEKLKLLCKAIKSLQSKSVQELKDRAEEVLHGQPLLLDRFLNYLPKNYS